MMSRLGLLCVVVLSIAFVHQKHGGCVHGYPISEKNDGESQAQNSLRVSSTHNGKLVSLSNKTTYEGSDAILASTHSKRSSIQVWPDSGTDDVVYFAAHAAVTGKPYNEYFGFVATLDVYGYIISQGQMSACSVWIVNHGDGSDKSYNSIRVGWMVSPELYRDSNTHFYTHWDGDWNVARGCYNTDCPGFQLEKGSKIAPGAIIPHGSTADGSRHTITVKVFKEQSSQNWWVYCGIDNDTPTAIGYYPANLFAGLAKKGDGIAFGGESRARRSLPTPPMGNGSLPSENAASIANIQFVDQDSQSIPVSLDLPVMAQSPKCYYVTPIVGAKFFYGGPAGCF